MSLCGICLTSGECNCHDKHFGDRKNVKPMMKIDDALYAPVGYQKACDEFKKWWSASYPLGLVADREDAKTIWMASRGFKW